MPQSPSLLPDSFFADLDDAARRAVGLREKLGHPVSPGTWQPQKILYWYDSIIDDMFANPGGTIKETAARLSRSPVTIGLIVRSDLFKARYAQRRDQFNQELDHRLVGKLAKVAETSLDLMQEVMDKKRDNIPLPLLNDITQKTLDRLGYGPQPSRSDSASISITTPGEASVTVSVGGLQAAREKLKLVEDRNSARRLGAPEGGARQVAQEPDPRRGSVIEGEEGKEYSGAL